MAERKDKDPVFGRLDDLDDISSLPLRLRNGGPASGEDRAEPKPVASAAPAGRGRSRREDAVEPGPAISVVSSLTTRTQSAPVDLDESAPGHPGAAMRYARERLGLEKADLAARTRLSLRIIEDLESNRFDTMPPAYVRGYLRTVARELDGDADSWIRAYEGMGYSEPVLKATVNRNASARWGLSGGIWGLLVGAILASALGLGVYAWTEGDGANPMASLTAWFGEVRQRFSATAPEAEFDDFAAEYPFAGELAEELPWLPGPEPAGSVGEPLALGTAPDEGSAAPTELPTTAPEATPVPPEALDSDSPTATSPDLAAATPVPDPAVAEGPAVGPEVLDERLPEVPAAAQTPPAASVEASVAPTVGAPVIGGRSALRLAFEGTSWIEVRSASDRVALRGIFHAGDERDVEVEMPARVILGNAPAVRLSLDGRPVALETYTREDRTARFTLGAD